MKPIVHIILPNKEDYPLVGLLGREIIDQLKREHAELPVEFVLHESDSAYEAVKNPCFMKEAPVYHRS